MVAAKEFFLNVRWGEKSIIALYASLVSGIVVALQFNPAEPFFSLSTLEVLAPFGAFWRGLHYYSSQLFFLFSVFHLVAIIWSGKHTKLPLLKWSYLVFALAVTVLLLFSGYVLRWDATGSAAGIIAENIALSVPGLGRYINTFLFDVISEGVKKVYAQHLIGLGVIWLVFSWDHFRRYKIAFWAHPWLVIGMLVVSGLFSAPMEPERLGMLHIAGPWFFLGLQEMLRYIQPFWAGVIFPLTFLVSLCLLPMQDRVGRIAVLYSSVWLFFYLVLSLIGFSRGL